MGSEHSYPDDFIKRRERQEGIQCNLVEGLRYGNQLSYHESRTGEQVMRFWDRDVIERVPTGYHPTEEEDYGKDSQGGTASVTG